MGLLLIFRIVSTVSSKFMVVIRRGAAGMCVASHVKEELRLALVLVPVPRQHTEDETATNWGKLPICKDVTHKDAQVKISFKLR